MAYCIRLRISTDHSRKKMREVKVPYPLYLQAVTSSWFQRILPADLAAKVRPARGVFEKTHRFFSDDYHQEYERSSYVRLMVGPQVHKFVIKVLSLNYQDHKELLDVPVGSFAEYFGDLSFFWDEAVLQSCEKEGIAHDVLFFWTTLTAHAARMTAQEDLLTRVEGAAKTKLAAQKNKISTLQKTVEGLEAEKSDFESKLAQLEKDLEKAQQDNVVLVPSDPIYMLGLTPNASLKERQARVTSLLKVLHPDKSGTHDTAHLFDMVMKARAQL